MTGYRRSGEWESQTGGREVCYRAGLFATHLSLSSLVKVVCME